MTSHSRGDASAALRVENVSKRFGSTQALRDVSFEVTRGEVHALLGHNGSGKSTLVKMVSGLLSPDEGTVTIGSGSGDGIRVGIVHQDLGLCPDATVLENCCMGGYTAGSRFLRWSVERRNLAPVLESLAVDFTVDTLVRDLSPADRAIVAIARALRGPDGSARPDLLILDEATARLRGPDAEKVLATARRVASLGGGVLIVTHHMSEVLEAGDRATVLANGAVVGTVEVSQTDENTLLEMVSGRQLAALRTSVSASSARESEPVLVVDELSGQFVHDVSFAAYPGEILGIVGATGAGFEELPYLICGASHRESGSITVDGTPLHGRSVVESRRLGVGLVPADRLAQGLHAGASVRENLSPLVRTAHRVRGLVTPGREREWAAGACREYQVKAAGPDVPVSALSGGNQQKVLLARALEHQPRLLLLHEPTQGVDEATRRDLLAHVRAVADRGAAVIYVSADIDEVAGAADRVLVVREGQVVHQTRGGLDQVDELYAASHLSTPSSAPAAS